ncbi:hypothetical protein SAMN05421809_3733 [Natronorubrum daqingense]|uniref:Uncharacterized protein n=1 Tax=Natronorubrum daqingense TaxID=588898 RepID=A0A1N7G513_9EURY|nr:hypothetical protein SAMN05421809_3733 [Natronorubrum daqingense]
MPVEVVFRPVVVSVPATIKAYGWMMGPDVAESD